MAISKKELFGVLAIVAILLTVFAFADLSISVAVYNPTSVFGKTLEVIGELPAALTATFSGAIIMLLHDGLSKGKRIASATGGAVVWLLGCLMCGFMPLAYVESPSAILRAILMIAAAVTSVPLVLRLKGEKQAAARKVALVGILLFFTVLIGFNLVKMSWGRMRFRAMEAPYDGFTRWLQPQGFTTNNEYMSLPSGHTAQASLMLMITLLPLIFPALSHKGKMLKTIAYGWIVLVAASRVVMGAHFASDVTLGFLVTFLLFTLWCRVILINGSQKG